ncbi:MAG: DUF3160 domain-containing protein, partial [Caldisericum exile]
MKKAIVFVIIITLVITSVGISLYLALQANKQGISNNNKENQSRENTQQKIGFVMAKSFETNASPVEFTINAEAKQYELPLNLNKVQNLKTVESKITIPKSALTLLKKNGFVVIETPKEISGIKLSTRYIPYPETITPKEDFFSYYLALETKELPKYITTDSILHFYHIFFEKTLIDFEKNIFTKYIKDLTDYFYNENLKRYSSISDPTIKETAKRNLAFFGVAELLQDENFKVDESVKDIVSQELDLINAHEG